MKLVVVISLFTALVAPSKVIAAKSIDIKTNSAYGYLNNYGLKLANAIREAELNQNNSISIQNHKFEPVARIVEGIATTLGAIPYQAGIIADLRTGKHSVCGGSLIKETKVLTAAHCWFDGEQQSIGLTVVLGSVFLYSGGTRLKTSKVIVHDKWYPQYVRNDIAMVYLPYAVRFSSTIQPIALPTGPECNENFVNSLALTSGFGLTGDDTKTTAWAHLRHVQLKVITNWQCSRVFGSYIQPSNICTKGNNRENTCGGDSGGPLVIFRNNKPILIGVTSFGPKGSCESGYPTAFTRVTSYIDWINKQL